MIALKLFLHYMSPLMGWTHDGPEQIAPLQRPDTLMQLSRSSILEVHLVPHGRAIHFGTKRTCESCRSVSAFGGKADIGHVPRRSWTGFLALKADVRLGPIGLWDNLWETYGAPAKPLIS